MQVPPKAALRAQHYVIASVSMAIIPEKCEI